MIWYNSLLVKDCWYAYGFIDAQVRAITEIVISRGIRDKDDSIYLSISNSLMEVENDLVARNSSNVSDSGIGF